MNEEVQQLIGDARIASSKAVELLRNETGRMGLRPSAALECLFELAGRLAPRRRKGNTRLTTSLLVFAATELGSSRRPDEDWPFLAAFAEALKDMAGQRFEEVRQEYFVPPDAELNEPEIEGLSDNTLSLLEDAQRLRSTQTPEGVLGVDACLRALLRTTNANALRNLDRMGVDVRALGDRIGAPEVLDSLWSGDHGATGAGEPPPPTGTAKQKTRERHEVEYVSDRPETARDLLGRAPLAFAVAAQINRIWDAQTAGERKQGRWRRFCEALHLVRFSRLPSQPDEAAFILHIDAPWGGGKTTFANFVARVLNPKAFGLDPSADALLRALPLDDDKKWKPAYRERRWHVVQFNAWQHEHVSPPWWNFYESIRRQCVGDIVHRDETAPRIAEQFPGIGEPLVWLRKRVVWAWYSAREWLWKILTPSVFRNGLVFAVLFVLVVGVWNTGWFQTLTAEKNDGQKTEQPARPASSETTPSSSEAPQGTTTGAALLGVITVLLTGGAGITVVNLFRSGLRSIVEGAGGSADATALGEADPLYRFQQHFSWLVRQFDQPVLVIVDDLDRCKPEYVVELVRGLMTIFRSPRVVFLLLGDKAWIETAFEHVHADMAKAHKDAQISFGGRFAEKAIQLSLILPEATDAERNAYLIAVLTGKLPIVGTGDGTVASGVSGTGTGDGTQPSDDGGSGSGDGTTSAEGAVRFRPDPELAAYGATLDTFQRGVRERLAKARNTEDLVRLKEEERARVGDLFKGTGDGRADRMAELYRQTAERSVDVEASFVSSTAETTEHDIRHGVEPVAPYLPGNPRRIKRIVNMVSAFQESGQIAEKIDPLSRKWRQLVLWTVIMSEYPQVWRTLVLEEAVAHEVVELVGKADEEGAVELPALAKGADEEAKMHRAAVAGIVASRALVNLLRGDPYDEAEVGDESHAIDDDTLVWLRRLTPLS